MFLYCKATLTRSEESVMKNLIERKKNNVTIEKVEDKTNPVAIIGIAARLGQAEDIQEFWEYIRNGNNFIKDLPESRRKDVLRLQKYYGEETRKYKKMGYLSEIDQFDYNFFCMSKKEANLLDPAHRLFLETTWKAIEDAGYGGKKIRGSKTGVYIGHPGYSQYKNLINEFEPEFSTVVASGNLPSMIASRVSYLLNLIGPSMLIDTACSSGLVAIHHACLGLKNGDCTMAIAGGVRISLYPLKNTTNNGISSKDEKTKTFDDSSDGTGSGEGVISIILKPLEKALDDRDHIYAVIKGSAINQDGRSAGITAPNPESQEEVIIEAWKNAGISPTTISYIEAHGTGTKLGDPIEIAGITGAFRRFTNKKQFCAIGSLKTNLGHLDSLAGVAGMLKAVLALEHGEIPPLLHFNLPNRNIEFENSPVYVCNQLQSWKTENGVRRCGVSAFGLSGTNCHIVLEEAPHQQVANHVVTGEKYIFTISAKTKEARKQLVQSYCQFIDKNSQISLADMCYTTNMGREHHKYRIAIVVEDIKTLTHKLKRFCTEDGMENQKEEGVYFNSQDETNINLDSLTTETTKAVKEYSDGNKTWLNRIACLYANGVDVDFGRMYMGRELSRISLPTYPFQTVRCWIDIPEESKNEMETSLTYQTKWYEDKTDESGKKSILQNVLVFLDRQGKGKAIVEQLKNRGIQVIEVQSGDRYHEIDSTHYEIALEEQSYQSLFERLSDIEFSHVIHAMTINEANIVDESDFDSIYKYGLFSIMYITKRIGALKKNISFVVISNCANRVNGVEEIIYPMNAMLFGWTKAIYSEYKNIQVNCIDIDLRTPVDFIIKEIERSEHEHLIAYRGKKRYVTRVEPVELNQLEERKIEIKENGVYVVTGGSGKVGLHVCNYFASNNKVHIISLNRTQIDLKNKHGKLEIIQQIRKNGSEIEFVATDVADYDSLSKSLQYIRDKYNHINGIIHCAAKGVGKAGTKIADETEEDLIDLLGPKVKGAWMLEQLTKSEPLDFMILFSSNITLSGGSASSAYISGNAFLDVFPDSVNSNKITVINFPRLQTGEEKYNDQDQLFSTMTIDIAVDLMGRILSRKISRCMIGNLNLNGDIMMIIDYLPFRFCDSIGRQIYKEKIDMCQNNEISWERDVKIYGNEDKVYTNVEKKIAETICKLLELDEIDMNDDFFELGGNSIFAIKLECDLEKYGLFISADELKIYNTVKKMAAFVEKHEQKVTETVMESVAITLEDDHVRVIEHIEPFNEIFYKSCFYNSLIPIILHYEKNITPIIINDICVYQKKDDLILEVCYLTQHDLLDIIGSMGIRVNYKEKSESIQSDVMNAINHQNPVIIWVDCYYASIRPDVYEKKHQAHTWLIFGYDVKHQVFHIIEHSIKDNLFYRKKVVSFDELENAYQGYLSHFHKMNADMTYYEFVNCKHSQNIVIDYKVVYENNILNNKNQIQNGLNLLQHYIEDYQLLALTEEQLHDKIDELVVALNDIINAKKIVQYRCGMIYSSQSKKYELISKILRQYQKIRGILVKYQYTSIYRLKDMEQSIPLMKDIYSMECEYLNMIIDIKA